MIAAFALAAALSAPPLPPLPLPGADKVKHFFVSAFVHSVSFSAARAAGLDRPGAQMSGAVVTMGVGVWKEVRDRRNGGVFSRTDLVWDAAGGIAAGALLNGTR